MTSLRQTRWTTAVGLLDLHLDMGIDRWIACPVAAAETTQTTTVARFTMRWNNYKRNVSQRPSPPLHTFTIRAGWINLASGQLRKEQVEHENGATFRQKLCAATCRAFRKPTAVRDYCDLLPTNGRRLRTGQVHCVTINNRIRLFQVV